MWYGGAGAGAVKEEGRRTYFPILIFSFQYPSTTFALSISSSTQHLTVPRPKTAERRNPILTVPIEVVNGIPTRDPG